MNFVVVRAFVIAVLALLEKTEAREIVDSRVEPPALNELVAVVFNDLIDDLNNRSVGFIF